MWHLGIVNKTGVRCVGESIIGESQCFVEADFGSCYNQSREDKLRKKKDEAELQKNASALYIGVENRRANSEINME